MSSRRKICSDLMMDPIVFHGREVDLLDTAEMARIRGVGQLSTVYMFHPNATHTRWHHSIGMAGLIKSFIKAQPPETTPDLDDQRLLVSAALTHDTGHAAWSHVGEVFTAMRGKPIKHDVISAKLVRGDPALNKYYEEWDLPRIAEVIDEPSDQKMIADLILGRPPIPPRTSMKERRDIIRSKMYMANMINGPADFDIAEYIMRDSFMCTSFHGLVDLRSLVENLSIVTTAAGTSILSYTNLNFAEALILAMELQYSGVYLEGRNLVAEELLIRALDRAYHPGEDLMTFWLSNDQTVMDRLRQVAQRDQFVDRVLRLMRCNQTYCLVDEINLIDSRLETQTKMNIKYLGDDEGRPRLLQLEKDVCGDLGCQEGDIVIGCWIWKLPDTAQAAIRVGGKDRRVASESRLLEVLRTESYVDSRSKMIIGANPKIGLQKKKIVDSILERLSTEDYTLVS